MKKTHQKGIYNCNNNIDTQPNIGCYIWLGKWYPYSELTGIRLILFLVIISALQLSCDDFVEVPQPNSQLTRVTVFEDKATANAALAATYAKLRENGLLAGTTSGLSHQLGNYTDELTYFGNPLNTSLTFYNNTLRASDRELANLWNNSYNQIYAANAILEGIQQSKSLTEATKNEFMGEAIFIRALLHFYLGNLYGSIPYITTTDYRQNAKVSKKELSDVYVLIQNDLKQAIRLLPEAYSTEDRVRPNKAVAHALLARLSLYARAWNDAADEASLVINNTELYTWNSNLDAEFLKGSTATIWQLISGVDGKNTEEGITFIFTSGPPPSSALSNNLMAAFAPNDLRKTHWIGTVTSGLSSWFYPKKYKKSQYTGSSVEYSILFRLAEMYLIRAEARVYQNNLEGAKEDLNKVRLRAGLSETTANTAPEIIDAVLQERRFEFFTELGHPFFDLKRTNTIDQALAPVKPGWDTKDKLFPIPDSELLLNPNLKPQNYGY